MYIVNSINTRPKFSSVLEVNDPSMPCENRNFPMNRFFYKPVDDRVQHRKKIPTTRHYFQAVKKSVIKYMQTENFFQSGQQQGCICIFFSTFRMEVVHCFKKEEKEDERTTTIFFSVSSLLSYNMFLVEGARRTQYSILLYYTSRQLISVLYNM